MSDGLYYICTRGPIGKPTLTLRVIELTAANEEPITFDVFGHIVRYVPECTCELEEPHSYQPMNLMTCSNCGMKTAVAHFCSWCGAKVVE